MSGVAHTFSIVGRGEDGLLGVAVSSRVQAVGALCPFVRSSEVAIACQAYLHPYLALDLLERLDRGAALADAAREALDADPGKDWRQLIAIGPAGEPFAHTGTETDPWAGHRTGKNCAAAGNLLVGEETVSSMVEAFEAFSGESLPERLLRALEAGQAAGGDRRGRQSAALLVKATQQMAFVDLRVDDHADPVAELRRLWDLMSPHDLERNLRVATTREPRPLEEVRARQAEVRRALAEEGR
jgi:uncharacterized Ntn-hydrolase superfamily protein